MDLFVSGYAPELAIGLWPVTLLLVSVVLGSAVFLARQARLSLGSAILSFLPFACTTAIMMCGVIFESRDRVPTTSIRPAHALILVLLISQVLLSGVLMWRLRACYMFVVSVSVLAFWVSFGAAVDGVMSVNGDGF